MSAKTMRSSRTHNPTRRGCGFGRGRGKRQGGGAGRGVESSTITFDFATKYFRPWRIRLRLGALCFLSSHTHLCASFDNSIERGSLALPRRISRTAEDSENIATMWRPVIMFSL
ncbi:hypothetical protein B0H12DRAFT_1103027, partial [Mycena haematopus]